MRRWYGRFRAPCLRVQEQQQSRALLRRRWTFHARPDRDKADMSFDRLLTTSRCSQYKFFYILMEVTNLVNTIAMEDMLALPDFSDFFRHFIVAEADETPLSILNLNGACAVDGFCDQRATVFDQPEQSARSVNVCLGGNRGFDGTKQRREQNHILVGRVL